MKAVCINKSDSKYMKSYYYTVGKTYDYFTKNDRFYIINDRGVIRSFQNWQFRESFKDVEIIREEKLKELGI